MIYRFKSQASADLIMLGPHGDQMLRLLGREPAATGIIEPAAIPAALAALQAAIVAEESKPQHDSDDKAATSIALRQRLWPMIEMLRRTQAAEVPVLWGV